MNNQVKISKEFVILSKRVSVFRNLKDYNFTYSLTFDDECKLYNEICSAFYGSYYYSDEFYFEKIKGKSDLKKLFLKGIVDYKSKVYRENSYIASNDRTNIHIKINCDEHLEIRVATPYLNFTSCLEHAFEIESRLSSKLKFAFNTEFGYLFQNILLTGSGVVFKAVLHLPAIGNYRVKNILENRDNVEIFVSNFEKYEICEDFYEVEFYVRNLNEIKSSKFMDGLILDIVNLEIEQRKSILAMKQAFYKEKLQKYKHLIEKDENVTSYNLTKYISICLLMKSLSLINNYSTEFLYEVFNEVCYCKSLNSSIKRENLLKIREKILKEVI
ncbi:MAG: ATP--guanido phosphotransferase [Peptoniphilaceae bacterium]|uniref:ATP--guanido phosphotransferase n=1 Tax=Parvimonas sp. TaxID=1944660 RepID=UPI0025E24898|nr:ATP--guanido phosphotransferase [Parvimonas sp.]MCI5997220.1 ATP--guanido phosphotransferase [Parvimonas sp.]MDD7764479.1 ATP--guanido phosphotransferase [Peptoniphilaceae bacterium]MDY3051289.1 ATP--guanido phosphotransferase [Parvimonas sp.]